MDSDRITWTISTITKPPRPVQNRFKIMTSSFGQSKPKVLSSIPLCVSPTQSRSIPTSVGGTTKVKTSTIAHSHELTESNKLNGPVNYQSSISRIRPAQVSSSSNTTNITTSIVTTTTNPTSTSRIPARGLAKPTIFKNATANVVSSSTKVQSRRSKSTSQPNQTTNETSKPKALKIPTISQENPKSLPIDTISIDIDSIAGDVGHIRGLLQQLVSLLNTSSSEQEDLAEENRRLRTEISELKSKLSAIKSTVGGISSITNMEDTHIVQDRGNTMYFSPVL